MNKKGSTLLIVLMVVLLVVVGGLITYIFIKPDKPKFVCSDKICQSGENSKNCLKDCPLKTYCGDDVCDAKEVSNPNLCPKDCPQSVTHTICQNQQCITVSGAGTNECTTNSDCTQPTHTICQNQQCVVVDGAGTNQCSQNSDCVTSTAESHFGVGGGIELFSNEMQEAGVEIVREWIIWREIEPTNNNYEWGNMDAKVQAANNADIEILGYPYGTPDWAHKNPGCTADICEIKDMTEFREFAEKVAERYDGTKYICGEQKNEFCGEMKYIEILNEVTQGVFFEKDEDNKYEDWLINGYEAVKEGNPDAEVLIGGFINPTHAEVFVKNMLENYDDYYDIVNFHVYETEADNTLATQELKQWIADYGVDKPMWITETATLIRSGETDALNKIAKAVIRRYVRSFGEGVEKVFWFNFVGFPMPEDDVPDAKPDKIVGLGWSQKGSSVSVFHPRPAYYAYKTMTSKLAGFSSVTKLTDTQYKFIVNNKSIYVLWCDSGTCSVDSEITGNIKVTDYLGNEQTKDASEITLTDSPIFAEET